MKKLVGGVLLLACLAWTPVASAQGDPITCAGYPQARVFVEAQSWWRPTTPGTGSDQGHGHFGACVPQDQTLSGRVTIDWVVKLHDNPGRIRDIVAEAATDVASSSGTAVVFNNSDTTAYKCSTSTCTYVIPTTFNTANVAVDGLQELQYRMRIKQPDGTTMRPALRFVARLANGKTLDDYSKRSLNAYGWHGSSTDNNVGPLYSYVRWHSRLPTTVSGLWTFNVSFAGDEKHLSNNITHYSIRVDPDFHASPPNNGVIFVDSDTMCPFPGRGCDGPVKSNFTIDTSRLANGRHKLVLKADAKDTSGSTNSGVLVIPFVSQN